MCFLSLRFLVCKYPTSQGWSKMKHGDVPDQTLAPIKQKLFLS